MNIQKSTGQVSCDNLSVFFPDRCLNAMILKLKTDTLNGPVMKCSQRQTLIHST